MASKAAATRTATKTAKSAAAIKSAPAAKAKVAGKDDAQDKDEGAPDTPLPLLDLNDAAVKKMIKAKAIICACATSRSGCPRSKAPRR